MAEDLKERPLYSIKREIDWLIRVLRGGTHYHQTPTPTGYVCEDLYSEINELIRRIEEKDSRIEELEAKIAELESISSPESTKEEE
jgi:predicted RNase H-like nuclease (RuvC/YqgF family)